jgi:hypothetical protein
MGVDSSIATKKNQGTDVFESSKLGSKGGRSKNKRRKSEFADSRSFFFLEEIDLKTE